jgi:hypothetical protein
MKDAGRKPWAFSAAFHATSSRRKLTLNLPPKNGLSQMWGSIHPDATASAPLLDRRALHRTKRAEHAAVTGIWAWQSPAIATFIEKLTGICGHGFLFGEIAMRAGQHGFEDDGSHGGLICARWRDRPHSSPCRFVEPSSSPLNRSNLESLYTPYLGTESRSV